MSIQEDVFDDDIMFDDDPAENMVDFEDHDMSASFDDEITDSDHSLDDYDDREYLKGTIGCDVSCQQSEAANDYWNELEDWYK